MIIRNLVIIAIILGAAFASQMPFFRGTTETFSFSLFKKGEGYAGDPIIQKTQEWFGTKGYPRVASEAEKRGEIVKEEIATQQESVKESALDSTKKAIAEKFLQTIGVDPKELVPECQPQT